jgi:hypothetical protein
MGDQPTHSRDAKILRDEAETHSPDGVDLTLIRWMLSQTPRERLETLQAAVWSIMRLRGEDTEA